MPTAEEAKAALTLVWDGFNIAACAGLPAFGLLLGAAIEGVIKRIERLIEKRKSGAKKCGS